MAQMTKAEYAQYLKSKHWKAKRKEAIGFYGAKCSRCGSQPAPNHSSYYMRVHHKSYEHLGAEPMEDLEVLCLCCHEQHHGFRDKMGQRTKKGQA